MTCAQIREALGTSCCPTDCTQLGREAPAERCLRLTAVTERHTNFRDAVGARRHFLSAQVAPLSARRSPPRPAAA